MQYEAPTPAEYIKMPDEDWRKVGGFKTSGYWLLPEPEYRSQ
jgi:hypothetical protein